jgi:hypothetical protein
MPITFTPTLHLELFPLLSQPLFDCSLFLAWRRIRPKVQNTQNPKNQNIPIPKSPKSGRIRTERGGTRTWRQDAKMPRP